MRKLTIDDIADQRAYERERDEFRTRIIAMKKRRRIALGDLMAIVFENTDTMRFQVQEMARIERMHTDEQIEHEIETYNELIPNPGELSATLFIEINDKAKLSEWLPKLVGIQHSIFVRLSDGSVVASIPQDEERLTREDTTTTTVHYVKFDFTPEQVPLVGAGPTRLVVEHPAHSVEVELNDDQRAELAADLF